MPSHEDVLPDRDDKAAARRLVYAILLVLLILTLVVLLLTPAQNRGEMVLKLLTIAASWPVVAGAVLTTFFVMFRTEISSYMKFAKVKYGDLELSAHQPATPAAALATVAMASENTEALAQPHTASDTAADRERLPGRDGDEVVKIKEWVTRELDTRGREVQSWKNLYLDRFLVDSARSVIGWLNNFKAVPEKYYESSWSELIPDKAQRHRIIRTLLELTLAERNGEQILLTDEGRQYLEHVYASAAAAGKDLPLPHPFVSRADVRAYGGQLNPHTPLDGSQDKNCHHRSPQPAATRKPTGAPN
jgi:uncharacterized integral membrane protein